MSIFITLILTGIFLFFHQTEAAGLHDVLINEVAWMGGADSFDEWIELKNNTDQNVDLTGWILKAEDGTPLIKLASTTLAVSNYYLLERTDDNSVPNVTADQIYTGALSDSGENLQLFDNDGNLVDEILCTENQWPAGNNENKLTMERKSDLSWQSSAISGGTPKAQNSNGYQSNENNQTATTTDVIINELLPNPSGVDDNEWIELKNLGTTTIDLINWKISDLAGTSYLIQNSDFATTTILANGFFILPKNITGISLNNSGGETVRLFDGQNILVSETTYNDTALDDLVWARDENRIWHWSTTQTSGIENIITAPESSGGGGGGTGAETKKYPTRIKINEVFPNPEGVDIDEWIELKSFEGEMFPLVGWKIKSELGEYLIKEADFKWPYIEANKFFLLPRLITGISLKNSGGDKIQLIDPTGKIVSEIKYSGEVIEGLAYMLERANRSGGSDTWQWTTSPTPLSENIYTKNNLMPKAYFEVSGEINLGKEILLDATESYDPENSNLIYEWHFNAPVLFNNSTTTTFATTTPMVKIILDKTATIKIGLKVIDEEYGYDDQTQNIKPVKENVFWWDEEVNESNGSNKSDIKIKVSGAKVVKVNLEQVKNLALGTILETQGMVSVLPGTLGVNIFYVAGSGIQIYCYKKDFPELKLGDEIKIIGELNSAYGELRIKIKDKNSLQILNSGPAPEPEKIGLGDLENADDNLVGSLLTVTGKITSVKSDYFYLDDETGEIKIVIKPTTDISLKNLSLTTGGQTQVTGILSKTTTGLRLLPRSKDDLIIEKVLGAAEENNKGNKFLVSGLLKYILALAFAIIIILALIIWRQHRPLSKNN